jgi:hypothetical protein
MTTISFQMDKTKQEFKVPIIAEYVPNVFFQVELVGETLRKNNDNVEDSVAPRIPAYASGSISITVPKVLSLLYCSYCAVVDSSIGCTSYSC